VSTEEERGILAIAWMLDCFQMLMIR